MGNVLFKTYSHNITAIPKISYDFENKLGTDRDLVLNNFSVRVRYRVIVGHCKYHCDSCANILFKTYFHNMTAIPKIPNDLENKSHSERELKYFLGSGQVSGIC